MAGKRIECFIDVASYYSYIAFADLLPNLHILRAYDVEVDFIPVLIAGINSKSGNRPPWTLPAKAKYGPFDAKRAAERVGKPEVAFPKNFMSMALSVLPMRALHYIKAKYDRQRYETVLHYLFHSFWTPPHCNLTKPEVLREVLETVPSEFPGRDAPMFKPEEVDQILAAAGSQECKDALKNATDDAVAKGAFGAPWLWVRNGTGAEEPFFGSDRFHHIYKFLGLPFRDIELLPPSNSSKL